MGSIFSLPSLNFKVDADVANTLHLGSRFISLTPSPWSLACAIGLTTVISIAAYGIVHVGSSYVKEKRLYESKDLREKKTAEYITALKLLNKHLAQAAREGKFVGVPPSKDKEVPSDEMFTVQEARECAERLALWSNQEIYEKFIKTLLFQDVSGSSIADLRNLMRKDLGLPELYVATPFLLRLPRPSDLDSMSSS